MEYFHGDTLRWAFGFENPNKAAVLFACSLPMAWALYALSWRVQPAGWRIFLVLSSGGAVLGLGYLLAMTYSRGGAVAGGLAVGYVIFRELWTMRGRELAVAAARAGILLALLAMVFGLTGVAGRAVKPLTEGDASVENRLTLWKAGLQMAAENPRGFGVGQSGAAYMNWYQPMEMTEGYRTMVNSYLTALVEWGWPVFLLAALAAAFLWGWANPGRRGTGGHVAASGLRGAVLGFATAGIFSTTMEERILWVFPGVWLGILAVWALAERRSARRVLPALAVAAGICAVLFAAGLALAWADPLDREYPERGCVRIGSEGEAWDVVTDSRVLGDSPGKLLRALGDGAGVTLAVRERSEQSGSRLFLAGASVQDVKPEGGRTLVLLAPGIVSTKDARALLSPPGKVLLLLPEIDEDGRAAFWEEAAGGATNVRLVTVEGVGRRVDWGWDQVIDAFTEFRADSSPQ